MKTEARKTLDINCKAIQATDYLNHEKLKNNWKFKACFATWDMNDFSDWIDKISNDRLLILQLNSDSNFECHVNAQPRLDQFLKSCRLSKILYSGQLSLGLFKRWMVFGFK